MKRTWEFSELVRRLPEDPRRLKDHPFSDDVAKCQAVLFDPNRTRREKVTALTSWLADFQPCLFGRMEAKQGRLAFCLLTENDLESSDQDIRQQIELTRSVWRAQARLGAQHGFLIVAVSRVIAHARPGPELCELAQKLCELYLGESDRDAILHDSLILEMTPGADGAVEQRSWKVGVNYFSAQGDGRWWHDHRFPGGIAFSMNSVGHMARTLAERERGKDQQRARHFAEVPREKLVYWALPKAMKTIGPQEEGSRRGTWLAPHGSFEQDKEPPSFEERAKYFGDLARFSPNRYKGHYHTDHTIPSSYFDELLAEHGNLTERDDLFFTYLHDLDDSDYQCMGLGVDAEVGERHEPATNEERESK